MAVRRAISMWKSMYVSHAIFERDGEHLSCEVPVSFATAALGGTVEVPTLDGDVTLKVPARRNLAAFSGYVTRA